MAEQTTELEQDFWLSWYSPANMAEFELHSPWWVSGYDSDDRNIVVAAVRAVDEAAAFAQVRAAYDNGVGPIEERFIETMTHETPFGGRFPQAGWMAWDAERTCGCPEHISPPAWCPCGVVDARDDGTCGNCGRRIMTDDDELTTPPGGKR